MLSDSSLIAGSSLGMDVLVSLLSSVIVTVLMLLSTFVQVSWRVLSVPQTEAEQKPKVADAM
jgi:hypothetical protein